MVLPLPRRSPRAIPTVRCASGRTSRAATSTAHACARCCATARAASIDGFTARNGRTYRGRLEIDRDDVEGRRAKPAGWNDEGVDATRPSTRWTRSRSAAARSKRTARSSSRRRSSCASASSRRRELTREERKKRKERAASRRAAASCSRAPCASARSRAKRRSHYLRDGQDRAADRLHLALRPPVLGDARAQGQRPPRLRVPAARRREGRRRRGRADRGGAATPHRAPSAKRRRAAATRAPRANRRARAAERPAEVGAAPRSAATRARAAGAAAHQPRAATRRARALRRSDAGADASRRARASSAGSPRQAPPLDAPRHADSRAPISISLFSPRSSGYKCGLLDPCAAARAGPGRRPSDRTPVRSRTHVRGVTRGRGGTLRARDARMEGDHEGCVRGSWVWSARSRSWLGGALLGAAERGRRGVDGRVQVHGYYEAQIRSIVRDFDFSDDWDLTQWWNILSHRGRGEHRARRLRALRRDLRSSARVEVRYDCVWTGACSMFDSANAYAVQQRGQAPEAAQRRAPHRLPGHQLHERPARVRRRAVPAALVRRRRPRASAPTARAQPMHAWQTPLFASLFGGSSYGSTASRSAARAATGARCRRLRRGQRERGLHVAATTRRGRFFVDLLRDDCDRWGARKRPGSQNGSGNGDTLPLKPNCKLRRDRRGGRRPEPVQPERLQPADRHRRQRGAARTAPRPELRADSRRRRTTSGARGIFYPNCRLQRLLDDDQLDEPRQNFRRGELAWNRGASQQDAEGAEGALRRHRDVRQPALDARRQPDHRLGQDGALPQPGSVQPAGRRARARSRRLEESRIALWAVARRSGRSTTSARSKDVRLELAMNFDEYRAHRPGRCGEPYAPLVGRAQAPGRPDRPRLPRRRPRRRAICPPDPWNDAQRPRVRRAPRVPLGPLQLRDHRLLRLPGLPVRRRSSSTTAATSTRSAAARATR